MRPQRFDLIVFDWDGTLFDSTAPDRAQHPALGADLGLKVPSEADAKVRDRAGLARCAHSHVLPDLVPERYQDLVARYRHHYLAAEHEVAFVRGQFGDAATALKARHHWLAVATGKNRQGLDRCLQNEALQGLFDATRTADETHPSPTRRCCMS